MKNEIDSLIMVEVMALLGSNIDTLFLGIHGLLYQNELNERANKYGNKRYILPNIPTISS